jgi:hypothetical protein
LVIKEINIYKKKAEVNKCPEKEEGCDERFLDPPPKIR